MAALVPCLLALGANLPGYEALWHRVPGSMRPGSPERLMPIACLAIAALAAFGLEALSRLVSNQHKPLSPLAAVAAVVVLAVDLRVPVFGAVAADAPSSAYAAIRGEGRLLELPVFRPDVHLRERVPRLCAAEPERNGRRLLHPRSSRRRPAREAAARALVRA